MNKAAGGSNWDSDDSANGVRVLTLHTEGGATPEVLRGTRSQKKCSSL